MNQFVSTLLAGSNVGKAWLIAKEGAEAVAAVWSRNADAEREMLEAFNTVYDQLIDRDWPPRVDRYFKERLNPVLVEGIVILLDTFGLSVIGQNLDN